MTRVISLGLLLLASGARASEDKMHFDVQHHFTKAEARYRAQMLFDYWAKRYGVQSHWEGDHASVYGRVMGVNIRAELVVGDDHIGGDGDDPGPLLRGVARNYITQKLRKYMHPQYAEP